MLLDNGVFEKANGYPSCYWGWGPEDLELGYRCRFAGYELEKRDGTYSASPHTHQGFDRPGVYTEEAKLMLGLFDERKKDLRYFAERDGLSNLAGSTGRHAEHLDRRQAREERCSLPGEAGRVSFYVESVACKISHLLPQENLVNRDVPTIVFNLIVEDRGISINAGLRSCEDCSLIIPQIIIHGDNAVFLAQVVAENEVC